MLDAGLVRIAQEDESRRGETGRRLPLIDLDAIRDKTYLTHGLHPYPAKFVPQIPRALIKALSSKDATILDPFCGSGTTLVEAALLGRNGIGVDSNKLATKITAAKLLEMDTVRLETARSFLSDLVRIATSYVVHSRVDLAPLIPEFRNREHWFKPDALQELGIVKALLCTVEDSGLRNLFEVVFSSIIVKCSRQESDTRWCAVDKPFRRGDAFKVMVGRVEAAIARAAEFSVARAVGARSDIYCSDVREISPIGDNSIDLVVTSPPYLNSFDYYLYHKLRLFWLDIDHYEIQESEIGSRNKHCDLGQSTGRFVEAMKACFARVSGMLKSDGAVCVVVGDSIYRGELIAMDAIYTEIAGSIGLVLLDQFSFDQRKYTRAFTPKMKTHAKKSHILLYGKP
jgi:site-specific DNA-methyltransferase (cytosine-N4-specific)